MLMDQQVCKLLRSKIVRSLNIWTQQDRCAKIVKPKVYPQSGKNWIIVILVSISWRYRNRETTTSREQVLRSTKCKKPKGLTPKKGILNLLEAQTPKNNQLKDWQEGPPQKAIHPQNPKTQEPTRQHPFRVFAHGRRLQEKLRNSKAGVWFHHPRPWFHQALRFKNTRVEGGA